MKIITGYKCDFCSKLYQREYNCKYHEARCKKNPDNFRACFRCKFCVEREFDIWFDSTFGSGLYEKRKLIFCTKLEKGVYPPKIEHKNSSGYELRNYANVPMPKECEFREENVSENGW